MEKTQQEQINDTISEALMGLKEAHEYGGKSRELLLKLLQFEGNRIDTLENKIDLLMTERAEVITMRSQIKEDRAYDKHPVTEEDIPMSYEVIHFEDYHFEVASVDEHREMSWDEAMKFEDHDDGWRLPTIDELRLMYLSKDRLGVSSEDYWSSSENSNIHAWLVYFNNGYTDFNYKNLSLRVRLVRTIDE